MNTAWRFILFAVLLAGAVAGVSATGLYRGVDADGNVVYSDRPFESAEKFTPPPISVVDTPGLKKQADSGEEEPAGEETPFRYLRFDIISPAPKTTLYNPAFVEVALRLEPGLNTDAGHRVWLLLDDRPVIRNSRDTEFNLDGVNRGAHTLQAQVRDARGKVVIRTRTTIIFVQRTSVY